MKIEPVTYMNGRFSLEIIGDTPVEVALLEQIFEHGKMERGNGKSVVKNGCTTGFYLEMAPPPPPIKKSKP